MRRAPGGRARDSKARPARAAAHTPATERLEQIDDPAGMIRWARVAAVEPRLDRDDERLDRRARLGAPLGDALNAVRDRLTDMISSRTARLDRFVCG